MVETKGCENRSGDDETHDISFYNRVMSGQYVGHMPLDTFFETFMKGEGCPNLREVFDDIKFDGICDCATEKDMYEVLARGILAGKISDKWELIITAEKGADGTKLKPDISLVVRTDGTKSRQWSDEPKIIVEPASFKRASVVIEVKHKTKSDPFVTQRNAIVESFSTDGLSTRGQIARYACEQFAHQHRCHVFQVVVLGRYARFLYWDRAGTVVSKDFDYVEEPWLLLKFFWLYNRLSKAEQGWDPSVSQATEAEQRAYVDGVDRAINHPSADYDFLRQLYDGPHKSWPVSVATVKGNDETRRYAIGRYFTRDFGPAGRGTRVFLAVDLETNDLCVLKDSWAALEAGALCEMDVYARLNQARIPHVVYPRCGGDVYDDGHVQVTKTQDIAALEERWRYPCEKLRTFVHRRLVLDIIFPIRCISSSKRFVEIIRDILETVHAIHRIGMIHGDITERNVGYTRDAEGYPVGALFDWDHASLQAQFLLPAHAPTTEGADVEDRYFRSATYDYMSIGLLKLQVHGDTSVVPCRKLCDFESLLWTFASGAIANFRLTDPTYVVQKKWRPLRVNSHLDTGAISAMLTLKEDRVLNQELRAIPFISRGLAQSVALLAEPWSAYYNMVRSIQTAKTPEAVAFFRSEMERSAQEISDIRSIVRGLNGFLGQKDLWQKDRLRSPLRTSGMNANQLQRLEAETAAIRRYKMQHLSTGSQRAITTAALTSSLSRHKNRQAINASTAMPTNTRKREADEKENRKKRKTDK